MKHFISTLCLLLFISSLSAQQVPLSGVVTVQNSRVNTGKTVYVPGVEVKHEKANPTLTDNEGKFRRYKITDPSFHNWSGLSMALRNQQISDFPLCNKSFNLSYCGYDL